MPIIPGSAINVAVRYGSRWLLSIEALNMLYLDGKISRNTYWTLYKIVSVKFRSSLEYYRVLSRVHTRDVHCTQCGSGKGLEMDHYKPLILYPARGLLMSNLRLLCKDCHNSKTKKERVMNFFTKLQKVYYR